MAITDSIVYDVWTNADPAQLTEIQLEIFRQWSVFATGGMALNGKIIKNPGGRYARSLRMESGGLNHVGIIADESIAPEAHFIEGGHDEVDMKKYLTPGKSYPLHYGGGAAARGVFGAPRAGGQYMTGFARMGPNSKPGSWIIPAMPAYAPGRALAEAAAKMGGGGTVSW
jgi:hypothetical protein